MQRRCPRKCADSRDGELSHLATCYVILCVACTLPAATPHVYKQPNAKAAVVGKMDKNEVAFKTSRFMC